MLSKRSCPVAITLFPIGLSASLRAVRHIRQPLEDSESEVEERSHGGYEHALIRGVRTPDGGTIAHLRGQGNGSGGRGQGGRRVRMME